MESQEYVSRNPRKITALLTHFLRKDTQTNCGVLPEVDSRIEVAQTPNKVKQLTVKPLSKEDFIKRIDTFSTATWFAKPLPLSPMQCARYGWENIDVNTLKCVSCNEIMYAGLTNQWEKELYLASCTKVNEQLKGAHKKICPWQISPTPESYTKVSTTNMKELREEFQKRVKTLEDFLTRLPDSEFTVLRDQSIGSEQILECLHKLVSKSSEGKGDVPAEQWNIIALMSLFAWQKSEPEKDSSNDVVMCRYCRRQVGLWNFLSGKESQDVPEEDEPPVKKSREIKYSTFNPVSEHRPWCPWIHVDQPSHDRSHVEAPWQILLDALLKEADPDQYGSTSSLTDKASTPPKQAWKNVRKIMSFLQSKESPAKKIKVCDKEY